MNKWSISLVIKKINIKIKLRYHYTSLRFAKLKGLIYQMLEKMWNNTYISDGNITFLKYHFGKLFGLVIELNICLSYNPALSFLGFTLDNENIHSFKDLCQKFYNNFIIAKTQEQYKCPSTCVWINKLWHIDTTEFFLFRYKKEQIGYIPNPMVETYRYYSEQKNKIKGHKRVHTEKFHFYETLDFSIWNFNL